MTKKIGPHLSIINLLRAVWLVEEGKKSTLYERAKSDLIARFEADNDRLMADIVYKPTPIQEKLYRLGYPGYPYVAGTATCPQSTVTLPQFSGRLTVSGGGSNQCTFINPITVVQTAACNQQAQTAGQLAQHVISQQGQAVGMDYTKTSTYKLIRALEELGADDPQRIKFRYDDDAADLADYRMVPDHIPVTQVVSMSLCNGCDPDIAVTILDYNKQSISEDEWDG